MSDFASPNPEPALSIVIDSSNLMRYVLPSTPSITSTTHSIDLTISLPHSSLAQFDNSSSPPSQYRLGIPFPLSPSPNKLKYAHSQLNLRCREMSAPLQTIFDITRRLRPGPLNGLLIVDISRHIPGPSTSTLLQNLGASVIRFEPRNGDPLRHSIPQLWQSDPSNTIFELLQSSESQNSPSPADLLYSFKAQLREQTATLSNQPPEIVNNGKFNAVLPNMGDPLERRAFYSILSQSHVLIESFRPGIMQKVLDLTPQEIKTQFPNLIVCSLTGFGQHSQKAGHDLNFQAMAGLLGTNIIPAHLPILTTPSLLPRPEPLSALTSLPSTQKAAQPLQICPLATYMRHHRPPQPLPESLTKITSPPGLTTMLQTSNLKLHNISQPIRLPTSPTILTGDGSGVLFAFGYILSQLYAQRQSAAPSTSPPLPATPQFHQFIDISLSDAASSFNSTLNAGISSSINDLSLSYEISGFFAHYTIYQTKDAYIAMGSVEPQFFKNVCKVTGVDAKYGATTMSVAPPYPVSFYQKVIQISMNCDSEDHQEYSKQFQSNLSVLEQHWASLILYNEYVKSCLQYEFIQKTTNEWLDLFAKHKVENDLCIDPILTLTQSFQSFIESQHDAMDFKQRTGSLYHSAGSILPISPLYCDATFDNGLKLTPRGTNVAENAGIGAHVHYIKALGEANSVQAKL